jgi:hypothetical protein
MDSGARCRSAAGDDDTQQDGDRPPRHALILTDASCRSTTRTDPNGYPGELMAETIPNIGVLGE